MESLAVYEIASKKDMRQEYATVKKVATIIIINITSDFFFLIIIINYFKFLIKIIN